MRIGLPRALVFYYYYPFWKRLFEELGCEVVVSDPTSSMIISEGIKAAAAEFCVPIKIFEGHVLNLLQKQVDFVFVPRFIRIESNEWFCPKFLGLPDLVRHTINGLGDKLLTLDIDCKAEDTAVYAVYKPICGILGITSRQLKAALKPARESWALFISYCRAGYTIDEAEALLNGSALPPPGDGVITVGLLGYVYNIYDKFLSMDVINKLRGMNVKVITFEMLGDAALRAEKSGKNIYWSFSRKLYNAGINLFDSPEVDGLIHITAFACGPDSVAGKLLELESDKKNKPFMTIRVDEHTGEGHVLTRIEAFTDMIKRKKASI